MSFELYNRNDKQLKCTICTKEFTSHRGKEVCSNECSEERDKIWRENKNKNKTYKIVCEFCKKTTTLVNNPGRRIYCNDDCKNNSIKEKKIKSKTPKIKKVKDINPMFLTRGKITYKNKE